MAQKYPGLYLYYDWLDGLLQLPPEVVVQIIGNLYNYSKLGADPEPLSNPTYNIIQNMYIAGLKRSKQSSEIGRLGGQTRAAKHADGGSSISDEIAEQVLAAKKNISNKTPEETAANEQWIRSLWQ